MSQLIKTLPIAGKFIRDERWDILSTAYRILDNTARMEHGVAANVAQFIEMLLDKGAQWAPGSSRLALGPLLGGGEKAFVLSIWTDGRVEGRPQ